MGRNPEWFAQVRARGVCYICRRMMDDADPRSAHAECHREARRGRSYADIRLAPPRLRPVRIRRKDLEAL